MIGEDQLKGDTVEIEQQPAEQNPVNPSEDEAFKQRKKLALAMIGRTEEPEENRIITDEDIKQRIESGKSSATDIKQILTSMQHDILILRAQTNEIVNLLNKLQIGFINKLNEIKGAK